MKMTVWVEGEGKSRKGERVEISYGQNLRLAISGNGAQGKHGVKITLLGEGALIIVPNSEKVIRLGHRRY